MARLTDLVAGFADVLKIPVGTVRNVAAVLRAEKLLTSGPRGPGAPHMSPTDATNLLLALMYDDAQDVAAANVPKLRAAELVFSEGRVGFDYGGGVERRPPPHEFASHEGRPHLLGDVLDLMFDILVRYGFLDVEPEDGTPIADMDYVSNISIEVSRPGHSARLWIDAHAVHWHLNYSWPDPEYAERRDAQIARGEMPQHALAHFGTYMSRSRSIRDDELSGLADVLRGQAISNDAAAEFTPPYDTGEVSV